MKIAIIDSIGGQSEKAWTGDIMSTLKATHYKSPPTVAFYKQNNGNAIVRRLTPVECARLQGFPDDWCEIGDWTDENGKLHKDSDSAKYKALGNAIALPYWQVLLKRISAQYERTATMGSLFSGIGGFDLCWIRCNGTKSVLWESEIESFPIAVCKKHFGDEDAGIEGDVRNYL